MKIQLNTTITERANLVENAMKRSHAFPFPKQI